MRERGFSRILDFCQLLHLLHIKMQNEINLKGKNNKDIGPVLSIRSDSQKGLVLSWNFNGLRSPNFEHYHLFIFMGQDLKEARTFYESYCSHLKLGEIMGICCRSDFSWQKRKIQWSQKSGYGTNGAEITKGCLNLDIGADLIEQICEKEIKKRGIIVMNIFCDSQTSKKDLINKIEGVVSQSVKHLRNKGKNFDKVVFNLISPSYPQSKLNTNTGLNLLHYDPQNSSLSCKDILVYLRTLTIKSLTLILSIAQKFSIVSFSTNQWLVTDCMELEKRYYALPKVKFSESIRIMELRRGQGFCFEILMGLSFTFFDGSQVRDRKVFTFDGGCDRVLLNSINATTDHQKYGNYEYAKGYFFQSNLLKQQSHILLSRLRESIKDKDKEKRTRECKTSDRSP